MKNKEFIINNYDQKKTFASFLPGIAGLHGIPLWCHYTNRNQAITSFGLRDKNGCILEFYPANTAYRIVDKMGFRTFIKYKGKVEEIFKVLTEEEKSKISRKMYISGGVLRLEEINHKLGLKIEVTYFILPNENIAGLVRKVIITNLGSEKEIEVLDGLTQLLPTDANEWMLKHQSNLLKSWMDVKLLNDKVGFYFENSIPADTAEVVVSSHGNYYVSYIDNELTKTIYDMNNIFGYDVSLEKPLNFMNHSVDDILKLDQVAADKVSGGFSGTKKILNKKEQIIINTVIGYSENKEFLINKLNSFSDKNYFNNKYQEAINLIDDITKDVTTSTNQVLYDEYMKQNYLDNILRGGIPYFIDTKNKHFVYHLFSRRHGDMEREYNFFSIAPEYYSQGNGNFRDVCQNRRSDNLFHPQVGIFNAKMFSELVQLDGYNPLGVLGLIFRLENKKLAKKLANLVVDDKNQILEKHLEDSFTPGSIVNLIEKHHLEKKVKEEELFKIIFEKAYSDTQADFGEGYWVDHWTYILDLVENVEMIEPDHMVDYLFNDSTYRYYNSPVTVLPRSEKYCLNKAGNVRQYGSLLENDPEKIERLKMNPHAANWLKYNNSDETVRTNLYSKLFSLAINKFTLLDPEGIGISMEANKPGWNDAMNGLPGIFSSGVSETIELSRVVKFLLKYPHEVYIPIELKDLIIKVKDVYQENLDNFSRWDKITTLVETFRNDTRFGVNSLGTINKEEILKILELMKKVLDKALIKALEIGKGIYPTFISYEAVKYQVLNHLGHYNLPAVKVEEFKLKPLPYFLEAPARSMKYIKDKDILINQYQKIKETALYDKKLKMYKTSVDLDNESFEIGRIRAFQKGWLERESNFLHMTYKYLLGLLKAGLYEEYFKEIKNNYTCFMDSDIYGRSVFENSSFIATSNNPDSSLHGQGFVARLSGSTAEALSMWFIMLFGTEPFKYQNNKLQLNLKPILSKDFIKDDNTIESLLFSKIKVVYHFKEKKDTYLLKVSKYVINKQEYKTVDGELIDKIRQLKIKRIDVYLE